MWQEFKKFAFKGNVIDMAVGVIIGGAFGKIVTSVVNDLVMPALGMLTGGVDFSTLKWVMSPAEIDAAGNIVKEEAAILYGAFIQNVIDFLLIAISIFLFVKLISKLHKKKEEPAPEPAPAKPTTEDLLAEIRDMMKSQYGENTEETIEE
ncbi:MAG: large-conductance mechanosensitive channel protein MscL [Ruminococcaceae bacterium]|nr:large-conductance mechanosensitive channel protein MscL [Oscillospiraceae bacterium]